MGRKKDTPVMFYTDRDEKESLDNVLLSEGLSLSGFLRGAAEQKIRDYELLGASRKVFNVRIEEREKKWMAWISPMGVAVYADSMQQVVAQAVDALEFAMATSGGRDDVVEL